MWLVADKACLTHSNMQRREMTIWSRCFMCHREVESCSHLFLALSSGPPDLAIILQPIQSTARYAILIQSASKLLGLEEISKLLKEIWIIVPACVC